MSKAVTRNSYTPEDIETGLRALALCNGNSRKARRLLTAQGLLKGVKHETIYRWGNNSHVDTYEALKTSVMTQADARVLEEQQQMVDHLLEIQRKTTARLDKQLEKEDLGAEALAQIEQRAAVATGINQDKVALARGRPTEIREERSFVENLRFLVRSGIVKVDDALIEGEAVEVEETSGA